NKSRQENTGVINIVAKNNKLLKDLSYNKSPFHIANRLMLCIILDAFVVGFYPLSQSHFFARSLLLHITLILLNVQSLPLENHETSFQHHSNLPQRKLMLIRFLP